MSTSPTFEELRRLGNEKFRSHNYGAALMYYTQCLDSNPDSYNLYFNRAVAFIKLDSMDEAKADLLRSLELNGEYIPSLCEYAFLKLYEGDTATSLKNYVKAVEISNRHPHQLERFKSQLKEAIRLTESRCRQQGYSQDYIDKIITDNIRLILEGYHTLPANQSDTGIPTVAAYNLSNNMDTVNARPSIAIASAIPISASTLAGAGNFNANANANNNGNSGNNITGIPSNIMNLPNGVSASISVGGPNQPGDLMSMLSGITGQTINLNNSVVTPATNDNNNDADDNNNNNHDNNNNDSNGISNNAESRTTSSSSSGFTTPNTRSTSNIPADILETHRRTHQNALQRVAELRRQHESRSRPSQSNATSATDNAPIISNQPEVSGPTISSTTSTSTTPIMTSNPDLASARSSSSTPLSNLNSTSSAIGTEASTIQSPTTSSGTDFARNLASSIAGQLYSAAVRNSNQADNAQPDNSIITNIAQNISNAAANFINGTNNPNNNFVSISTDSSGNVVTNNNGNNSENSSTPTDLTADMDLDLD